jgi:hypothetical protein
MSSELQQRSGKVITAILTAFIIISCPVILTLSYETELQEWYTVDTSHLKKQNINSIQGSNFRSTG